MSARVAFFKCISCGVAYELKGRFFRCRCGGLLDIAGLDDAFSPDLQGTSPFPCVEPV
ncbi:MAG: hypothetical protein GX594_11075 [Pirellulaceae bacterium]|nr:hypothetical protein [Pirellulaceae bacterium]